MNRIVWALAMAGCIGTGRPMHAQFRDRASNPAISVALTHPPSLGIQAKRIAFGLAGGPCSDQLIDMLTEDFVRNNVEVIDREHLNALTKEHNFTLSGYVDQSSAAELGRILGPTALVFVKVQRCAPEKKSLYEDRRTYDKNNPTVRVNISRTQFFFRGSIQTVDLGTGRIFSAKTIDNSPSRQNESPTGEPEFPSEFDLQDESLRLTARSVNQMFFPWTENRRLIYFDDNDCNLKQAYQLVKSNGGDTIQISRQNLETCRTLPKVNPRALGHANYNLGMSYYFAGDYSKALEYLQEAGTLRPGDIVTEAIGLVTAAQISATEMQRVEQRMAVEADENVRRAQQSQADAAAKQPKVLSVKEVLAMKMAGLSEDLIQATIRKNNRAFDLSIDEMLELKKSGVSEALIKVMLDPNTPPLGKKP